MIDIERFDFKAFNESQDLATTIDHYFDVHGYYPDEILADTLYRTRENRQLCQRLGIRLSGPRLGRKPKRWMLSSGKLIVTQRSGAGKLNAVLPS